MRLSIATNDKDVQIKLKELIAELDSKGAETMSEIYALTSASLYGIIFRNLGNEAASAEVLKSVYARVWDLRKNPDDLLTDSMNRLRAMAHRYALDHKVKHGSKNTYAAAVTAETLKSLDQFDGGNLSSQELSLLKLAYLNALPMASLAQSSNCSEAEMERRIRDILSKIRRPQS